MKKILVARRGEGKTRGCVELLRRNPHAFLVVHSAKERDRVRQQYTRNEHFVSRRILSFDDVVDGKAFRSHPRAVLVIDNADLILEQMFERPIEALAVTWPEVVGG